jgi:hypothetical protein
MVEVRMGQLWQYTGEALLEFLVLSDPDADNKVRCCAVGPFTADLAVDWIYRNCRYIGDLCDEPYNGRI